MGIYDRDYYRGEQSPFSLRMPQTIVVRLILINVGLWLINGLLFPENRLQQTPGSHVGTLAPLQWYRFLTYGFVHELAERLALVLEHAGAVLLRSGLECCTAARSSCGSTWCCWSPARWFGP